MHKCRICGKEFDSVSSIANHTRWQHKRHKSACKYCHREFDSSSLVLHEIACSKEKNKCIECKKETRNDYFCSSSCSAKFNNKQGKTGYASYRKKHNISPNETYRDICFEHWERKCAIPECSWEICVDVHHIDGNHTNDELKNLIPLCQNHHMMTRLSKYRKDMKQRLVVLIENKGL